MMKNATFTPMPRERESLSDFRRTVLAEIRPWLLRTHGIRLGDSLPECWKIDLTALWMARVDAWTVIKTVKETVAGYYGRRRKA